MPSSFDVELAVGGSRRVCMCERLTVVGIFSCHLILKDLDLFIWMFGK